jgi:hypothetical protein
MVQVYFLILFCNFERNVICYRRKLNCFRDTRKICLRLCFEYIFGVSIAARKHLISSRTQKLSSLAVTVVLGRLSVRIARCTYFKKPLIYLGGFFLPFFELKTPKHLFSRLNMTNLVDYL